MGKDKRENKTTPGIGRWWRSLRSRRHPNLFSATVSLTQVLGAGQSILMVSLVVTASLVALRKLTWTESLELSAYDQLIQWQTPQAPDPRLLIVGITEKDIQNYQRYPLPDDIIHQLLLKLEAHQPRVIGLDIYRDIPQPPGREALMAYLQEKSDRLVTICQLSKSQEDIGVPPPAGLSSKQLGFADLVIDRDGVIRRSLLLAVPLSSSPCQVQQSFALQLTRFYLQKENLEAVISSDGILFLGSLPLTRLQQNTGGYQGVEDQGYQILLKYHSPHGIAQKVTLTEVLADRVDPSWIRDRLVLIGVTAPSLNDYFYTPYSSSLHTNHQMSGVEIHAQMVSQLLHAVLNDDPLMGGWSEGQETLWIWGWAWVGGLLSWKLRHPLYLSGGMALAIVALLGATWIGFEFSLWIPLFSPALGLLMTSSGVFAYSAYQTQKTQELMLLRVQQQQKDLELLKTLLEENTQFSAQTQLNPEEVTQPFDEDVTQLAPENVQDWTAPHEALLGGRYHIIKVLGAGGFGQTYLAEDIQRPKHPECVIKHLRPMQTEGNFFQVAQRLFRTEAEILEVLGQHEQIPRLFAYFEEYQEFYLVEEYIPGHGLSEEIQENHPLEVSEVLKLMVEILEVLCFVHQYQVIHRDIKPSNIIRRERDRRLCLIDFGAVKQFAPDLDETTERFTVAIGTKGYAAPEQMIGQPRLCSDVYSVGMIGIHALTGIAPQKLRQDWSSGGVVWHHLVPESDVPLMDILDRMVAYHFRDRYPSAREALNDLKQI